MSEVYAVAANVLFSLERHLGSLKSITFGLKNVSLPKKKKIFALCTKTLENKVILDRILAVTSLLTKEPRLRYHLALVMVYDLLCGKGLHCSSLMKAAVLRHKSGLLKAFATENKSTIPHQANRLPRYVRINTIKSSEENVIKQLCADGYELVSEQKPPLNDKAFCLDRDIPHLLVFNSNVSFVDHALYKCSHIVLQDKASCFPAFLLSPPPGSHVIDTCAAPGNKTLHLASIMADKGSILALDKDKGRFDVLNTMIKKCGATCVTTRLQDFLTLKPLDYCDVEYILVDPSCSGSGMVNRYDFKSKIDVDFKRLSLLARFQEKVLSHALKFPSVKRVIYSTCSWHKEENECVVAEVLKTMGSVFELIHVLPEWKRRGLPVFDGYEKCARMMPEDGTNGFFVALFQRKTLASEKFPLQSDVCERSSILLNKRKLLARMKLCSVSRGHPFKKRRIQFH